MAPSAGEGMRQSSARGRSAHKRQGVLSARASGDGVSFATRAASWHRAARMAISHWFSQLDPAPVPRPSLPGSRDADVCIVGAGFTGLWTAYELRRADPSLDVVVLEAEVAGFGASGRNGGWLLGELAGAPATWIARGGRDGLLAQAAAIQATVDEVGTVVEREGIACDFRKGGSLHVAQTPLQLERIREHFAAEEALGLTAAAGTELLGAEATAARIRVDGVLGGRFFPHCARVQPAKLARGLADAAERAGAIIHEGTRVTGIEPAGTDGRAVAHSDRGTVRARVVVRATEGYTARLRGLRRALVPLNSAMIVTVPLPDQTWEQIGWERAECLLDGQLRYVYLQRTGDGRIAIGGRGVPYRLGSRTDREGPLPAVTARELRDRLVDLFPVLRGAGIASGWHGVLGVPRDWTPAVGIDRATGLAWGGGYVGEGVAAANLAGRTLRDLVLERDTELTHLPWVAPPARPWEPEPLRFAGVRSVNALMAAADRRESRTGRPALAARLANLVAGR
jgi:glycine/D-amino acid oxidase-like deaminating enzyme